MRVSLPKSSSSWINKKVSCTPRALNVPLEMGGATCPCRDATSGPIGYRHRTRPIGTHQTPVASLQFLRSLQASHGNNPKEIRSSSWTLEPWPPAVTDRMVMTAVLQKSQVSCGQSHPKAAPGYTIWSSVFLGTWPQFGDKVTLAQLAVPLANWVCLKIGCPKIPCFICFPHKNCSLRKTHPMPSSTLPVKRQAPKQHGPVPSVRPEPSGGLASDLASWASSATQLNLVREKIKTCSTSSR